MDRNDRLCPYYAKQLMKKQGMFRAITVTSNNIAKLLMEPSENLQNLVTFILGCDTYPDNTNKTWLPRAVQYRPTASTDLCVDWAAIVTKCQQMWCKAMHRCFPVSLSKKNHKREFLCDFCFRTTLENGEVWLHTTLVDILLLWQLGLHIDQ